MNPISSRQATGVLLVVLSGWSLTMTAQDGRDGWIVLLLAGLCSLPVAALCCLASERMPQGDWFQLPRAAFGTVGGALYVWTLAALAFWSLCMTVLSGVIFLRTVSGGIWPVWLLTAALLVCAAASAQHGVRQLALWAQPMVWLVVLALLLSLVLSWKQLDCYELRPILSGGVRTYPNACICCCLCRLARCFMRRRCSADREHAFAMVCCALVCWRACCSVCCICATSACSAQRAHAGCCIRRIRRQVCCHSARRFSAEKC